MYTDRFSLAFVSGVLMSAAELRRPGLGKWTPEVRAELHGIFTSELQGVKKSFFELFQDQGYWERLEHALLEDVFPRYAAIAEKQTALELRDFGVWRGGDLLARLTYAGVGLVVGGLSVKLPFIPIPAEWDFFAFATMIAAPFVPDLQVAWHKRRHRRAMEQIMREMSEAERNQKLYEPLGVAQLEAKPQPISEIQNPDESPQKQPTAIKNDGGR